MKPALSLLLLVLATLAVQLTPAQINLLPQSASVRGGNGSAALWHDSNGPMPPWRDSNGPMPPWRDSNGPMPPWHAGA